MYYILGLNFTESRDSLKKEGYIPSIRVSVIVVYRIIYKASKRSAQFAGINMTVNSIQRYVPACLYVIWVVTVCFFGFPQFRYPD